MWNSGDGLCWVEGRVYCLLSTVYTSSVLWCASQWCVVVMAECGDSACLVLSHCVVGCGMAVVGVRVCGLVACLPLPFLVGGVRGSARAALRARTLSPNTIASPVVCFALVFSRLLFPRFSSPSVFPIVGMAVCDSPCVGVLCWHDGDG